MTARLRCLSPGGMYALAALLLAPLTSLRAADAPPHPNIVFILADDLGWTDTATYGSQYYETPNLDRLAAQGMRFNSFHACQNCQPTRAALMTGQYAPRTGIYTVGGIDRFAWWTRPLRPVDNVTALPLNKVTIAQALQKAGYATAMFGKWHLGQQGEQHPGRRGFDQAIVSMGRHFDFATNPKTDYPRGQYLADFLTDRAVAFIQEQQDKPFFLYLPHFAVHSPHQAKPEEIERFQGKPAVGGHRNPTYAAMIASVDESVGRVMQTLEELKLADHTVLLFSSDNGGVGGYVREGIKKGGDVTDNAPLRSGKGSLYEGGTRVPLIVRWPGVIQPGSSCDVPAIHVDLFPTFLEIAGAPAPPDQPLDGESLVTLFRDSGAALRRDAIYQHFPGYLGAGAGAWRTTPVGVIQSGDWKLMEFFENGRLELYNLREDIGEQRNLAQEMPDQAKALHAKLRAWRQSVGAPMPTPHRAGEQPPGARRKKAAAPPPPSREGMPGPWNNDVIVYRVGPGGRVTQTATFERAGVATVARLKDGRLIAAHQHFPENDEANFDKVAVRFSSDEGATWTAPQVIRVTGLPEGMRFPFDPTLVPLPNGQVRLYFTSLRGRRFEEDLPAIYSAISNNGVDYVFEPGRRFGLEDRIVIDCAVVLHQGVYHLYAPDNGRPRRPEEPRGPRPVEAQPPPGVGYHATSRDGLHFARAEDVRVEGDLNWLGSAYSDGQTLRFIGTSQPSQPGRPGGTPVRGGIWMANSPDGHTWKIVPAPPVPVADPGAVTDRKGGWIVLGTGPPRRPSYRSRN